MTATATFSPHSPTLQTGVTKRFLSPARQQLLVLLQTLNFGRIERLEVRGGEPVFDPLPAGTREVKFAGENGCRPEARMSDFVLKEQHIALLRLLDEVGDGTILALTVKHGLPFSAEVPG